jgi:hypothetical protein
MKNAAIFAQLWPEIESTSDSLLFANIKHFNLPSFVIIQTKDSCEVPAAVYHESLLLVQL